MVRTLRFAAILIAALALVTWLGVVVVRNTTRAWFERDLESRAKLVVNGAGPSLIANWAPEHNTDLRRILTDITRDDHVMGVALCSADLTRIARTVDFAERFGCREIGRRVRTADDQQQLTWNDWHGVVALPGGNVYVSAIPVMERDEVLGFAIIVQDLSFLETREAKARDFLLAAFALLAAAILIVTLLGARLSWLGWTRQLRRVLRGSSDGEPSGDFQPLLSDLRELVDRVVAEEGGGGGGAWTPERLKSALNRYLRGEKVIVIANREPYIHERIGEGIKVMHPASGLVTALEPVMRACSGVWIGHGGGSADRETADAHGRVLVPPGERSYTLRRVWLTREQEQGYYYGFANEGLWPLCHIAHARPVFRAEDYQHYKEVNEKFAEAAIDEADSEDPVILVQDYHFALVPRLIRNRLPRATIIMFWHIPWPNSEHFGICPWRDELLEGMLGASILGFHTQFHCNNFLDSVDRVLEARIDRDQHAVVQHGRATFVRPYPISLEWPNRWQTTAPPIAECRARALAELGLRDDALIGVGVDRMDYTKGVEERLLAVERLLDRFPAYRGRFTFVQIAAPSRTQIERYRELGETVVATAERINQRFGDGSYKPIVLLRTHHEPPDVFCYYRAADLCYVSSLHDGMNLVAKEFIAARDDERGVLVLSQFTGAARELPEALIVNPYDLEEASSALNSALSMPADEQRARMRSMRMFIAEFNIYRWAGRMIADAARLRSRDRLAWRFSHAPGAAQ
jgi:trehalose 6-phosphate synthase